MPALEYVGVIVKDDESGYDVGQGGLGGRCGKYPGKDRQPALNQAEKPRRGWREFGRPAILGTDGRVSGKCSVKRSNKDRRTWKPSQQETRQLQ